jgi:hypothetical protein
LSGIVAVLIPVVLPSSKIGLTVGAHAHRHAQCGSTDAYAAAARAAAAATSGGGLAGIDRARGHRHDDEALEIVMQHIGPLGLGFGLGELGVHRSSSGMKWKHGGGELALARSES